MLLVIKKKTQIQIERRGILSMREKQLQKTEVFNVRRVNQAFVYYESDDLLNADL